MKTLVTGSLAFDTILVFEDQFNNHILPDQIHILNVAFLVPTMQRHHGGTAGNIAYNLKLLGGEPVIMATVGTDFDEYMARLEALDLDISHIKVIDGSYTAQATIVTDIKNNQITAFHPGAMNSAHENKISDAADIGLGIVGPDGRDAMIEHARDFAAASIPFIFDPGQGLPMFDGDELLTFCEQANYIIVNDYESQMLMEKTGNSVGVLADSVEALIVTKGGEGSVVYANGEEQHYPAAAISEAVDPTGCGDAYRGGILYGLSNNLDLATTVKIASLCGAIKIEQSGTQNHSFTREQFAQRYQESFGEALDW